MRFVNRGKGSLQTENTLPHSWFGIRRGSEWPSKLGVFVGLQNCKFSSVAVVAMAVLLASIKKGDRVDFRFFNLQAWFWQGKRIFICRHQRVGV